jgi:hypothetical protein
MDMGIEANLSLNLPLLFTVKLQGEKMDAEKHFIGWENSFREALKVTKI